MNVSSHTLKVLVWAAAQESPRRVWASRVAASLRALLDYAGVSEFLRYDEARRPHRIAPDDLDALEELIAANVNVERGTVFHDLGRVMSLVAVGPSGAPEDGFTRVGFTVGVRAEGMINTVSAEVPSAAAPNVLRSCIDAWSPTFGCVQSKANANTRRKETEPAVPGEIPRLAVDRMLHWVTWYGPGGAAALSLDRLSGRPGVQVQEVYGGVEVRLGAQWPGEAILRERQRELEPLLFGDGKPGLWRRLRTR